jgi:hypothetical protein
MRRRLAHVVLIVLAPSAALGASVVVRGLSDAGGDTAPGVTVAYGLLLVGLGVVLAAVALHDARRR